LSNNVGIIQVSSDITHEGTKNHLDDPVLKLDFPIFHCLGIGSSVSGIRLDQIRKYMSKIWLIPNLLYPSYLLWHKVAAWVPEMF
jgi:hypothetical protein